LDEGTSASLIQEKILTNKRNANFKRMSKDQLYGKLVADHLPPLQPSTFVTN